MNWLYLISDEFKHFHPIPVTQRQTRQKGYKLLSVTESYTCTPHTGLEKFSFTSRITHGEFKFRHELDSDSHLRPSLSRTPICLRIHRFCLHAIFIEFATRIQVDTNSSKIMSKDIVRLNLKPRIPSSFVDVRLIYLR